MFDVISINCGMLYLHVVIVVSVHVPQLHQLSFVFRKQMSYISYISFIVLWGYRNAS